MTVPELLEMTEWAVSIRQTTLPLAKRLMDDQRAAAEMRAKVDKVLTNLKESK